MKKYDFLNEKIKVFNEEEFTKKIKNKPYKNIYLSNIDHLGQHPLIDNYKTMFSSSLEFTKTLNKAVGEYIDYVALNDYDLEIHVSRQNFLKVIFFLKQNTYCQYKSLTDIICVDYPGHDNRFQIFYLFLSVKFNSRIYVVVECAELESMPSITCFFNGANWPEREVWDMFGVFFDYHPDLRRILTDYGFEGFPLRKDFPLSGFSELYYCENKKRIVYAPVSLSQEYRNFKFTRTWKV